MKGCFLQRLLVNKLCFGVVLLIVPTVVLFSLDGSPIVTNFSVSPEQLKAFFQGFQQQQRQERLGDDAGLAYDNHTQKSTARRNKGEVVADNNLPLYSGNECRQWLSLPWACRRMERTDFSYESYRWHSHGCEMPEFSGQNFLKRMRHKTLAFVGDSLGREQFQSMMCIATGGKHSPEVEDVGWKYGLAKAPGALRPDVWAYRFPATNTTVLFYWSVSLSELEPLNTTDSVASYALHLDRPVPFLKKYLHSFDILVLNTRHHWNRGELIRYSWELYADGRNFKLYNIARWLDSELLHYPHMKVFLRTMSPRHFVCDSTIPLSNGSEVLQDYSSDLAAERAVSGTRVKLLDITAISQLRSEGHI